MTRPSRTELALVAVGALAAALARGWLPHKLAIGEVALLGAGLLLAQGLARDLARLYAGRAAAKGPRRRVRCTCVESAVGVGTIVAGVAALAFGVERAYALPAPFWPAFVVAVGMLGFLMKDLVLDLDQRRVRRERAHSNISIR